MEPDLALAVAGGRLAREITPVRVPRHATKSRFTVWLPDVSIGHHRRLKYRKAHIASSGSRSPLQTTWLVAIVAKASEAKTQELATAERSVFLASLTREAGLGRRQSGHSEGDQPVQAQEDSYRSAAIAAALQDVPGHAR